MPSTTPTIAVLAGDGIGPDIVRQALKVLEALRGPTFDFSAAHALVGGAALEATGHPLPPDTLDLALRSQAVLFGAVGAPQYDAVPPELRPEKAILGLRRELGLYASFKAVAISPELAHLSPLKNERVAGVDLLVVRELDGDAYTAQPKGERTATDGPFPGHAEGYDTMRYAEGEVRRVAHLAFQAARQRRSQVCSVDKANVLASSRLWRRVVTAVGTEYPDVSLTHLYADNTAMQLMSQPTAFDVLLTGNLFGDILSDVASVLSGSIGLTGSALLGEHHGGLFEAGHGTAMDLVGQDKANPLACIRAAGLLVRHALDRPDLAQRIESAVQQVLRAGGHTADMAGNGPVLGTDAMGDAVVAALNSQQTLS